MSFILLLLYLQGAPASEMTRLPSSVRPLDLLPELKGSKILSRNGYTLPGFPKVGRVFRYSIQGDMDGFLKTLQAGRRAKDGWKVTQKSASVVMFERNVARGPLAMQAFLVQKARAVADPAGRGGIRVIQAGQAPGWLWVSYNEHIRTKK